ncbi:hypothetical protein D9611_002593 [Ephemerocybe angulata]|uniref:DUF1682-domain-containing protein n=1 Tax=Ephemerocybe angulata TaxID=980116 RepID=A0A8H5C1W6_9AGAR|nr:hypothetical protein D9611_002593 [Tulosesus angulatus]
MSFLPELLARLAPPPVHTTEDYDGWEFRWKYFVFRPATLKTEGYLVLGLFLYILVVFYGISRNKSKAKAWLTAHLPIYQREFSRPQAKDALISDGNSDFFNFSTGRRNITSLHTIFTLRPRHDLFQILYQTAWSLIDLKYQPEDEIQLDFQLAPNALASDFVWGVVSKSDLAIVKKDRWDLTFTKTTESPALPATMSVMSEFADVTENLLKPIGGFSLTEVLKDPKIQPYFRSLSSPDRIPTYSFARFVLATDPSIAHQITDQPRQRPASPLPVEAREKHLILNLRFSPSPETVAPLLAAVFQLIDSLNKVNLRPETKTKLRKVREDTDKQIKEEKEKEAKEEQLDAKAAAKKKAEEERIAKLTPAEQKKELERQHKRNLRKSQGKMAVRK